MNRPRVMTALALTALAIVAAGCGSQPAAPTRPEAPAASPSAPPSVTVPYVDHGFPPAPAGAAVYGRTSPSEYPGSQRLVLLETGRFGLQYLRTDLDPALRFHEYPGTYARTETGMWIAFDNSSRAGPWEATVTLDGDLLFVRYGLIAIMDGFEDGIYVRQPAGP